MSLDDQGVLSSTFDDGPWTVTIHVDVSDGTARCVGLEVRGFAEADVDQGGGDGHDQLRRELTTTDLRKLRVPKLLARACRELELHGRATAPEHHVELDEAERRAIALKLKGSRYDLDHYERVARIYTENLGAEPTKAVAEALPHLSRAAVKKHVAKCREFGLLGPTQPGRAGGGKLRVPEGDTFTMTESEELDRKDSPA